MDVYGCERYLERTQWWRKSDLRRLQFKKLKGLLMYAYDNVPYYRSSFRAQNFRPADLNSLEDMRKVPVLKKSAVRTQLDAMVSRNVPVRKIFSSATSGTTAVPTRFYRGKADQSWAFGSELRAQAWAGYRTGNRVASVLPFGQATTPALRIRFMRRFQRVLRTDITLNIREHLSEESMADFANTLERFRPDFVQGYTNPLTIFATYLLHNSRFEINPRAVFTTGATLFPNNRRAIEAAFKCKVYDQYGSSELSHFAGECGEHEGLHVSEENVLLEIVRDDGLTSAGEDGRVLVTNLNSHFMPFIRYDIGDVGKILPETCSCGRELSLVKPIGRTYEYFMNSDGSFTTLKDFQIIFEDLPVRDFQVVQESHDEIVINVVAGLGYTDLHTEFIRKNIKVRGSAKIVVKLVDSIPPERSGKTRHVVTKIPTKYT